MSIVSSNRLHSGFTLLELLTILTIVGVLMIASYPLYTHYVLKTRRAHVEISLLSVAAELEHYYILNHTYQGAVVDTTADTYRDNPTYRIDLYKVTRNSYEIRAIPEGLQKKDTVCGTLSLDESGKKGITGSGSLADCW